MDRISEICAASADDDITDLSGCDEETKRTILSNAALLDDKQCDPCQPTQPECGECEFAGCLSLEGSA